MEERGSRLSSSSSSGSSTLSPFALPFTINRSNRQNLPVFDPSIEAPYAYYAFTSSPTESCVSVPFLQPSIPNLSSHGVSTGSLVTSSAYYNVYFGHYNGDSYHPKDALAVDGLADADWYCSQSHPFHCCGSIDDFCAPIDSVVVSTEAHCAQGTSNSFEQLPELRGHFWPEKGSNGCGLSLPEQGFSTTEGLKTWGGNSSLSRNCTIVPGKDDVIGSGGATLVTTDFLSFPLGNSRVSPINSTLSRNCTIVPGKDDVIGSGGATQVTTDFLSFPPGNSKVSPTTSSAASVEVFKEVSQLQKQYSGPVINSWKHCHPTFSALNPLFSRNGNCGGICADSNTKSIGNIPFSSSIKETNVLLNADDGLIDKGNERKDWTSVESCSTYKYKSSSSKPVSYDSTDPLWKINFELQGNNSKRAESADDIILDHDYAETGFPVKISTEMFDKSDSELDSPCWKGTLAFHNSPFKISGTLNSQVSKNDPEEGCSGLNPLAPQFYPCNAQGNLDCCENKCFGDDLLSSSMDSAVVNLSSRECHLEVAVEAGSCSPKAGSEIGPQIFSDIHATRKEPALLKELNSSSEKFSHLAQQSIVGDHFICEEKPVVGANVAGFVKGVSDATQNVLSCVPSIVIGHVSSTSPSGIRVSTELTETLLGASNSLSTPPKLDAQIIVNAMHNLSEILVQNCSNDMYSLMEHENNTLQQVINNLYVCFKKSVGRRTPMPESSHPGTSYCPKKSTDLLEVTGREVGSDPHQHTIRMTNLKRNSYKVQDCSSPSSDSGIGKVDSG